MFYQVVHISPFQPTLSLVQNICYPESAQFSTAATMYGRDNEKRANEAYKSKMGQTHSKLKVTPAGLIYILKILFWSFA